MTDIHARFVHVTDGEVHDITYVDGSPGLGVMHEESYGRPEVLSVNLSEYGLVPPERHVYVKDNSEHEGLPDALVAAGVAVKVREVEFGPFDSKAWLMKVTQ